jgi:RND family efflux transporter MFP subunit
VGLGGLLAIATAWGAAGPVGERPAVTVGRPVAREVTDYEDVAGRTEPAARVEVRARVTGYLVRVCFKEGAEVKRGDLLLEIDPRPYQAALDKAGADLALAEAHYRRVEVDSKRAEALLTRRAVGQEEYDRIAGERRVAEANVQAARAAREVARLNLDFARVSAPVDGHVGRQLMDPGNLVRADETVLTTLVSNQPMYVYFDVDERTALRLRRGLRQGGPGAARAAGLPVAMGLADEDGFPRRGTADVAAGSMDPAKGTLQLRAVFPNADGFLVGGLLARVHLPVGVPYRALVVPEEAVHQDGRSRPYVVVVNDNNVVESRAVELGPRHDRERVVKTGLRADDWVVVGGGKDLRAGMTVRPSRDAGHAPGDRAAPGKMPGDGDPARP